MANSIYEFQNDGFLLRCQRAQRSIYSKAKKLSYSLSLVMLVFTLLSFSGFLFGGDLLSAISSLISVILTIVTFKIEEYVSKKREIASSIQQYIDASLYSSVLKNEISEWGCQLSRSELVNQVGGYDTGLSSFKNWYSDYSSFKPEWQVFYCQCENFRWDSDLLTKYRNFNSILIVITVIAFLCLFCLEGFSLIQKICIVSFFLTIANYFSLRLLRVNKTIHLLHDLNYFRLTIEEQLSKGNNILSDLIKFQKMIYNRRKNGYLIPDWFYHCYCKSQQKQEDCIASLLKD